MLLFAILCAASPLIRLVNGLALDSPPREVLIDGILRKCWEYSGVIIFCTGDDGKSTTTITLIEQPTTCKDLVSTVTVTTDPVTTTKNVASTSTTTTTSTTTHGHVLPRGVALPAETKIPSPDRDETANLAVCEFTSVGRKHIQRLPRWERWPKKPAPYRDGTERLAICNYTSAGPLHFHDLIFPNDHYWSKDKTCGQAMFEAAIHEKCGVERFNCDSIDDFGTVQLLIVQPESGYCPRQTIGQLLSKVTKGRSQCL